MLPTENLWNRALYTRQKKQNFTCLSNSRYLTHRAQNLQGPTPNNVLIVLRISSKSVYIRRSYSRTRKHRQIDHLSADSQPKPTDLAVSLPISGSYHPHPPSPFIIITQLEDWYSSYHPTEGRRLSRPRHCRKGVQLVPKVVLYIAVAAVINTTALPAASHTTV